MIKVFGIKQCNSMKKAFDWLDTHHQTYEFHDYKKFGLSEDCLNAWLTKTNWQTLLNTKGTTWRKLPEDVRQSIDAARAQRLMLAQPTLIKRPVLEAGERLLVGFDEAQFASLGDKTP